MTTNPALTWDAITTYMSPDLREQVHAELAPCTRQEFLARYLALDPEFQAVLDQQFTAEDLAATLAE